MLEHLAKRWKVAALALIAFLIGVGAGSADLGSEPVAQGAAEPQMAEAGDLRDENEQLADRYEDLLDDYEDLQTEHSQVKTELARLKRAVDVGEEGSRGEPSETEDEQEPEPPAPSASFGEGTYQVGADIEPGTYRAPGGQNCYWARLRNFSGGLNSIIANGGFQKNVVVEILASDTGFESNNCGTWSRI